MATALAYVGLIALILTLGSTLLTIWLQSPARTDLINLTKELLSWKVIAGGLATAFGTGFKQEIKDLLGRIAK